MRTHDTRLRLCLFRIAIMFRCLGGWPSPLHARTTKSHYRIQLGTRAITRGSSMLSGKKESGQSVKTSNAKPAWRWWWSQFLRRTVCNGR